jgi:hypothetical protein
MPPKSNNKSGSGPNGNELPDTTKAGDDVPACQSCRKKKARCDRAQPCSQCVRFNVACLYDNSRMKPGLRAGAVDQLYQRIETLESMFLGQEMLWQQVWHSLHSKSPLPEQVNISTGGSDLSQRREQLKSWLLEPVPPTERPIASKSQDDSTGDVEATSRSAKRQRVNEKVSSDHPIDIDDDLTVILPPQVMTELVDFYFVNCHPWIPVLHVANFRERMRLPQHRPRVACILHAIIAVCARFSQSEFLQNEEFKTRIAEKSRQKVILESTESFSVENLQALVIIAFETVGRLLALKVSHTEFGCDLDRSGSRAFVMVDRWKYGGYGRAAAIGCRGGCTLPRNKCRRDTDSANGLLDSLEFVERSRGTSEGILDGVSDGPILQCLNRLEDQSDKCRCKAPFTL